MNIFNSIVSVVLLVCFIVGGVLFYRHEMVLQTAIIDLGIKSADQAKRFDQALGRAEIKIDTTGKLLEALSKKLPEEIRRDLDERNAEVISIATASFRGSSGGGGRASVLLASPQGTGSPTIPGAERETEKSIQDTCNPGPYEWSFGDWRLAGKLKAYCGSPGKFEYELNQKHEIDFVSGDDGSEYVNLFEIGPDGKRLSKAIIERFNVFKKAQDFERFYWWAPHLDIAGNVNHRGDLSGEATISLMGYGKTNNDLSWRFVRGGVVYNGSVGAVLCPVSYNVGGPLPLLSNVWFSPCYQYINDHAGSVSIGAQL